MNLKYYYWYFQSAIPERICDDIVRYGKEQKKEMALTGNANRDNLTKLELKNIQKKRKSDFVWDWSESCQFTEYKKGQYYDWHCDSYEEPYNNPENANTHGKLRKLSMTVSLTDPDEYEGGDLEFDFRNTDEGSQPRICEEIRKKGSVIIFPSFVWHRVKPVTKGIRHSLVCWNLGYPFR